MYYTGRSSWLSRLKTLAIALGVLVTLGNCSIPIAVMIGLVENPEGPIELAENNTSVEEGVENVTQIHLYMG